MFIRQWRRERLTSLEGVTVQESPWIKISKGSIIDRIISDGGEGITGYIPRSFTQFSDELRVSINTVKSVWYRYCEEMQTLAKPKGGLTSEKLQEDDLELIEVLKVHSPAMSLSEIIEELGQFGRQQISMSAVSRAIKNRLPSGQQYSRKKLTKVASERFTPDNLFYTQLFINYLSSKDPRRLKCFDEAGIKIPTVAQKCHGNFNLLTAVSICSRQFQFRSRQFQFAHGSFNLLTAVSICSRQFQFRSRQFQFTHGSFNFAHGNFNLPTAVSICSRQFQFRS